MTNFEEENKVNQSPIPSVTGSVVELKDDTSFAALLLDCI